MRSKRWAKALISKLTGNKLDIRAERVKALMKKLDAAAKSTYGSLAKTADVTEKAQKSTESDEKSEGEQTVTKGEKGAETADNDVKMSVVGEGALIADELKPDWWFTGKDGKRRYEISDEYMEVDINGYVENPQYVKDFVKHDRLFAAYPEIKDYKVKVLDVIDGSEDALGSLDYDNKTISVKKGINKEQAKDVFLHETQHAIQHIEEMISGTNKESAGHALFNRAYEKVKNSAEFKSLKTAEARRKFVVREVENSFREYLDSNGLELVPGNELNFDAASKFAYSTYYGEIEADNTTKRRYMTEEELAANRAENNGEIYNRAEKDAKFIDNLIEIGYTENEAKKFKRYGVDSYDNQRTDARKFDISTSAEPSREGTLGVGEDGQNDGSRSDGSERGVYGGRGVRGADAGTGGVGTRSAIRLLNDRRTSTVADNSETSSQGYLEMIAETEKKKESNATLVEKFLNERSTRLDGKSVPKFLKDLIASYESEAWYGDVEKKYRELSDKVYNDKGKKVDAKTVTDMFREIATIIFDGTTENEFETLVKDIHATEINIPDRVKAEFGKEWNDFRTKNFGNLSLRNERGESISEVYNRLSESHPELFSSEVTDSAEQLKKIAEVTSKLRAELNNRVYNEAQANIIERITSDLIEGTMSLDPQILYSYKANNRTKDYYKKRIADLKQAHAEWTEKVVGQIASKNERQKVAYDKKMSYKRLKELGKALFAPTKKKHIPENMSNDLAAFFRKIKFPEGTVADIEMGEYFDSYLSQNEKGKESKYESLPPAIADTLQKVNEFDLASFNSQEMHEFSQMIRAISQAINQEDKLYHNSELASEVAHRAIMNIKASKRNMAEVSKFIGSIINWHGLSAWDAEGLFNYIGIPELYDAFLHIAEGQNDYAGSVQRFTDELARILGREYDENGKIIKESKVPDGWRDESVKITLDNERTLNFSKAQIMSLYLLAKQADSRKRLLDINGGIELTKRDVKETPEKLEKLGKIGKLIAPTKTVLGERTTLTEADLDRILSEEYLTAEMKEIADEISKLLSGEMADALNAVSLKLDGYKRFGIQDYFPMIVSDAAKNKDGIVDLMGAQYEALMIAKGFTLDRTGSSGVTLVLDDIFSVMDRHILGASQYIGYEGVKKKILNEYRYFDMITSEYIDKIARKIN